MNDTWIVLHGFGQLAASFAEGFASIASPNRLVIAPEALNRFYVDPGTAGSRADAKVGTTWMTREDRENEIADYVDFLDAVHVEVVARGSRVTVLGFSQGVATAARWIALGRSRADRLIVWAGQLPPDLDLAALGARLDGRLLLVGGRRDEYASWVKVSETEQRLATAGIAVDAIEFDGGHRLDDATLVRLAEG